MNDQSSSPPQLSAAALSYVKPTSPPHLAHPVESSSSKSKNAHQNLLGASSTTSKHSTGSAKSKPAYGHMSEEDYFDLASKYNLNDIPLSEKHHELQALSYRIKAKEDANDQYLQMEMEKSERKLRRRLKHVLKETSLEEAREKKAQHASEVKERFILEVDKAVENRSQLAADRRYHQLQADLAFPTWLKKLLDVRLIAVSQGHNGLLKWRSKCKTVINEAVTHAESTDLSIEFKNRLKNLSLGINLLNAKQLTEHLKEIHLDYMRECSSNDSKLGYHSKMYLEAIAKKTNSIVPLESRSWSADLSLMNFTASVETRNLKSFTSTIDTFSTAPKTLETSSIDRQTGNRTEIRRGNLFDRFENIQAIALSNLRLASANGDFDLAWAIFRHHFDLRVIASKSVRKGSPAKNDGSHPSKEEQDEKIPGSRKSYWKNSPKKQSITQKTGGPRPVRTIDTESVERMTKDLPPSVKPPTLEIFRLLMVAFKNSFEVNPRDPDAVIESAYANGFRPDRAIMNIYLASCIKDSLWRKALGIIDCFEEHDLIPSTRTFEILLDCCRHSLEEPATIFETLRLHGLPKEFCYKASIVNAGNRMSPQVALENLYEINKNPSLTGGKTPSFEFGKTYMFPIYRKTAYAKLPVKGNLLKPRKKAFDEKKEDNIPYYLSHPVDPSTSHTTLEESSVASTHSSDSKPRRGRKQDKSVEIDPERAAVLEQLRLRQRARKWNQFRDSMKNTLPRHSPGKLLSSKSAEPFERHLEKLLNRNFRGALVPEHPSFATKLDLPSRFASESIVFDSSGDLSQESLGTVERKGGYTHLPLISGGLASLPTDSAVLKQRPFNAEASWVSEMEEK